MVRSGTGNKVRFARRVRELRVAKGWTYQQLAKELGVVEATVVNWETERHFATMHIRKRLCELLGTDLEDLGLPPYDPPF